MMIPVSNRAEVLGTHHGHGHGGARTNDAAEKKNGGFASSLDHALKDEGAGSHKAKDAETKTKKKQPETREAAAHEEPAKPPPDVAALALLAQLGSSVSADDAAPASVAATAPTKDAAPTEASAGPVAALPTADELAAAATSGQAADGSTGAAEAAPVETAIDPKLAAPPTASPPDAAKPARPDAKDAAPGKLAADAAKTAADRLEAAPPAPEKAAAAKAPATTASSPASDKAAPPANADAARAATAAPAREGDRPGSGTAGGEGQASEHRRGPRVDADGGKKTKAKPDDDAVSAAPTLGAKPAAAAAPGAPVVAPSTTESVKDVAGDKITEKVENVAIAAGDAGARTGEAVRAAEAAGHKRTLAAGEARGQIETPELGRIEVVAHASALHESGRVEVHVRAVEDHARQVLVASTEALREHVRVEVPQAAVHVEGRANDLLGGGASAQNFADKGSSHARDGRGDDAPATRAESVKSTTVSGKGTRVRFVL